MSASGVQARSRDGVFWYYAQANQSPRVTASFLARQRRLLLPGQYSREHENQWVDGRDQFTTQADVDAAMIGAENLVGDRTHAHMVAVDIGWVEDPAVIGAGYRDGERVVVNRLITLKGSREGPVQLAAVESLIQDLAQRFRVTKIRIESWQGVASLQRLAARGLPVEMLAPTAKVHAEEWPALAQALTNRTLVLPRHERLREELLGLSYEVGPTGVKVTDRGHVHQDHAVVVRMLVAMLARPARVPAFCIMLGATHLSSAVPEDATAIAAELVRRNGGAWFPGD